MQEIPPISHLFETLFLLKFVETERQASKAIKDGDVYVEDIRVANPKALLVITHPTRIRYRDDERIVKGYHM
jgi:predicted rRNA methylase YqxC with S4 and FtsJ domains